MPAPDKAPLLLGLGLTLVLAGCGRGDAPDAGDRVTVDTLASGRVVVTNPSPEPDAEGAGLEEVLRLGSATAEGPELFGQILDVELGPQGEILVLDGHASEIRVFGADGDFLRTLGGPGEGPGELSRPAGMAVDGTRVVVMNWGNARYTIFDLDTGDLVEEHPRQAAFGMFPWPGRVDGNGRIVDVGLDGDGEPAALLLDGDFTPADTLDLPEDPEDSRIAFRQGDRMMMAMALPFTPRPQWTQHPGEGIWVGPGSPYRLHHVGASGDTLRTVVLDRDPLPVPPAVRDSVVAAVEERVAAYRDEGLQPDGEIEIPGAHPAYDGLTTDADGRLWVSEPAADGRGRRWDVFSADGVHQRSVGMPHGASGFASPSVRDGRMALIAETDGVPQVVIYRFPEPAGA